MTGWEQLLTDIALTAAAVAAIGVIWKKGVVPVWRLGKRLAKAADQTADAAPVLLEIADQFRPNDGGSLYDRLIRIEHVLEVNAIRLCRVEEKLGIRKEESDCDPEGTS